MAILDRIKNLLIISVSVIVYGYLVVVVPKLPLVPVLISIAYSLWLASFGSVLTILAPLIALGQCFLVYYNMSSIGHAMFLLLNVLVFMSLDTNKNNTKVKFRPYEKEIRNLLFKHKQADMLSNVDSMLEAYSGRENELLQHLQEQFRSGGVGNGAPFSSSPEKSKSAIFNGTREKIYRLLRKHQPNLVPDIDDLIKSHRGDEEALLAYLRNKINVQENPSSRPNSTPVKQNHQDIVENARWEAKEAIKARILAASNRGQATRR
jgi:hypothetical protein